jgi:hypothetical protein
VNSLRVRDHERSNIQAGQHAERKQHGTTARPDSRHADTKDGVLGGAGELSGFADLVENPEHHDCGLRAALLVKSKAVLQLPLQVSQWGKAMHIVQHLLSQISDGAWQDLTLSAGNIFFCITLIPMLRQPGRPPLLTCIPTGLALVAGNNRSRSRADRARLAMVRQSSAWMRNSSTFCMSGRNAGSGHLVPSRVRTCLAAFAWRSPMRPAAASRLGVG